MANIDRIEVNCITMAIYILWVLVLYKSNRGDINVVNYCYDGHIISLDPVIEYVPCWWLVSPLGGGRGSILRICLMSTLAGKWLQWMNDRVSCFVSENDLQPHCHNIHRRVVGGLDLTLLDSISLQPKVKVTIASPCHAPKYANQCCYIPRTLH